MDVTENSSAIFAEKVELTIVYGDTNRKLL